MPSYHAPKIHRAVVDWCSSIIFSLGHCSISKRSSVQLRCRPFFFPLCTLPHSAPIHTGPLFIDARFEASACMRTIRAPTSGQERSNGRGHRADELQSYEGVARQQRRRRESASLEPLLGRRGGLHATPTSPPPDLLSAYSVSLWTSTMMPLRRKWSHPPRTRARREVGRPPTRRASRLDSVLLATPLLLR